MGSTYHLLFGEHGCSVCVVHQTDLWPTLHTNNLFCRLLDGSLTSSVMTAVMDGMDQSKFRLPKTRQQPSKLMQALFRPCLHICACWIHGVLLQVYVAPDDLKKDSNCQTEALFLTLGEVLGRTSSLPLGLHVQMDNCYREGKNQFFLMSLMLMVLRGTFRWTAAGFLRSGHSSKAVSAILFVYPVRYTS